MVLGFYSFTFGRLLHMSICYCWCQTIDSVLLEWVAKYVGYYLAAIMVCFVHYF
jgi:hypothetical protein